jgi:hypothetical protein
MPTTARVAGLRTSRSFPVAFQYPVLVARFVRDPVAYLRSLKLKKYHSLAVSFAASARNCNLLAAGFDQIPFTDRI